VAQSTVLRLRGYWLNVHKWIGICLAILIIPISVTGAALVWDEPLDRLVNPQRYDVTVVSPTWQRVMTSGEIPPSVYERSARQALGADARIVSIRYPEGTGPIVVTAIGADARAQSGPPPRVNVWLDPNQLIRSPLGPDHFRARVLDTAPANAGLVRVFHNLHGNLLVGGGLGRAIVGWVGVFMFISCLTGIWLWWPIGGSVRRGFRWKRQNSTNANIHHLVGFWILLPLAMLSFTGVWIAAPAMVGSQPPRPAPPQPLAQVGLSPDAALAAVRASAGGDRLTGITWPTDRAPEWKVAFERSGEIAVDDATGVATAPRRAGGQQRPLMRRWHDGTGMGPVWQTIIFLGGIIPAILSITGLVMWWRSRGWKKALARKRRERTLGIAAAQPAE
jgi:uncharacterized iron-regulated membrane protein